MAITPAMQASEAQTRDTAGTKQSFRRRQVAISESFHPHPTLELSPRLESKAAKSGRLNRISTAQRAMEAGPDDVPIVNGAASPQGKASRRARPIV